MYTTWIPELLQFFIIVSDDYTYGLHTYYSSSSILLASSLTIETISKNNGGGGNHGGRGTIKTITDVNTKEEKK